MGRAQRSVNYQFTARASLQAKYDEII